jgi:ABC-type branched-subunit amino acid transport system substrate-binding protein
MKTIQNTAVYKIRPAVVVGILLTTSCSAILGVDNECNTNSDCESSTQPNLLCRKHLCVLEEESSSDTDTDTDTDTAEILTGNDLLQAPCTRVDGMDDLNEKVPDDAIIIGSILPITGELSVAGAHFDQVTLLAIEEINRAGGIQGSEIIRVACDSGTSAETAGQAAEHLRDIGVQALLGPFSSEIALSVYNDVLRDAGMLMVTAGANAPIISTVSSEGMIWSTSLPAEREAIAMATHVLNSDWERVAVIYRSDAWGDSLFNTFYSTYCSGDGIDCTDKDSFSAHSYDTGDIKTSLSKVITELTSWQPDITVAFSYIEDTLTFLTIIGTTDAPIYSVLWNSTVANDHVFSLLDSAHHSTLCRMQATSQQMPDNITYESFLTRYRATFDGEDPVPYTASFYDAAYLLGYAYAAASDKSDLNPTGKEIAAAMTRLSSGTAVNAGAEDWNVGVGTLRSSDTATIDYVGVSGDVDYPSGTGTGSIVCPVEAVRFNVENQSVESVGVIYSTQDKYSAPDYSTVSTDKVCGDNIRP